MNRQLVLIFTAAGLMAAGTEAGRAAEVIGHRGASHDAPENTLASVNLAWGRDADAVEIDVRLSRDGEIVAVHDETTKRYGGPDRKVAEQTLAELKALDVGGWKDEKWAGERIPTLGEVLETIPAGKRLYIEVKCGPEIVGELARVIRGAGKEPEQTAVISFDYEVVCAAKKALPELPVYLVVGLKRNKVTRRWSPGADELVRKAEAAGLEGLDIGKTKGIDAEFARAVKQAGLRFCVWTVNDPAEARRLIALGVEGITTDRPGWLREQLRDE